jgi:hypothetical protein
MGKSGRQKSVAGRRPAFRFQVLNLFVDEGLRGLTRAEVAVWLVLYRDTKPGGVATASVGDLAVRAGLSRRNVVRAVGRLRARGMLKVVRKGGLNAGPSSYRVFPVPMG